MENIIAIVSVAQLFCLSNALALNLVRLHTFVFIGWAVAVAKPQENSFLRGKTIKKRSKIKAKLHNEWVHFILMCTLFYNILNNVILSSKSCTYFGSSRQELLVMLVISMVTFI